MAQEIDLRPHVTVLNHELDVVHDFVYLGSAIPNSVSLNTELQKRIGEALHLTDKTSMDQQQTVRTH